MASKTLDLGCGHHPQNPLHCDEVWGVDIRPGSGEQIRMADLAIEPIPFESEFFDAVTAFDFIEHIPRLIYIPQRRFSFVELMNEVCRVLKPGGAFVSHTPAFPKATAFQDPTHVNFITEGTFPEYFCGNTPKARMYGFHGFFSLVEQKWMQTNALLTFIRKSNRTPSHQLN